MCRSVRILVCMCGDVDTDKYEMWAQSGRCWHHWVEHLWLLTRRLARERSSN